MSSKRRLRRNGCDGKVNHVNHAAALVVIAEMKRRGRGENINAYRCPIRVPNRAPHYHIGHVVRSDRAYIA